VVTAESSYTYNRVRKHRKYCSQKCAMAFHGKFVRDSEALKNQIVKYYQEFPAKRFLASTKSSAKKRNLVFELNEAWFDKRLSNGKCEATGLPIKSKAYQQNDIGVKSFYSPSIDRIDNTVGYTEANSRMVCWGVNLTKNSFTDRDLNALSLSVILSHMPKSCQPELLALLPANIIASLPSGHSFPIPN